METITSEVAGRALAAWLAPYMAEELGLNHSGRSQGNRAGSDGALHTQIQRSYDAATCETFVEALGVKVLVNSRALFEALVGGGEIGSLRLVELIDVKSPRNVPSVLTTPLKRRAKKLGLGVPWAEATSLDDRTVWVGIEGVSERMLAAVEAEIAKRLERDES